MEGEWKQQLQREIDCLLGVASESSFLFCRPPCRTPPACKRKQMQQQAGRSKRAVLTERRLTAHPVSLGISPSGPSLWPEALQFRESRLEDNMHSTESGVNLMTGHRRRCVITRIFLEKGVRNKITILSGAKWGVIGSVPAGYIVVIADVVQSFSSVVCCPQKCIHRFKSTQRQELGD